MTVQIDLPQAEVAAYCRRWQISELALFGSVLREDFRQDSDVDVLVRFRPEAGHSLFDLGHMEQDLARILGRPVDLVERAAVEQSRNYLRRKSVLDVVEVIHAA